MARQLTVRRQVLAGGAQHLGWKAGFASAAARERFGTAGPLFGFLTDGGLLPSGSSISIDGWTRAVLEAEIAIHLGRDLPAGAAPAEIRAAIAGLGAAIEVADFDPELVDVESILAGDIFHRHLLLGPPDPSRAGLRTADVGAIVTADGAEVARSTDPAALTTELVVVLGQLAVTLEEFGERLRAGDVVIGGSLIPPMAVTAGPLYRVEVEPLGSLEVRFTEVAT
jgi:2-keto-4-pentenoate hydratase